MILGGDIGGTKTHLILIDKESNATIKEEKFPSQAYKSLEDILKQFLSGVDSVIERACFGIAGPIKDNSCVATNLPWVVHAKTIEKNLKIQHVKLINDLEANAYGIFCLKEDELITLNRGNFVSGNQALISAGTGLGEAGLSWVNSAYLPFACEGGHADFAPTSELEVDLWKYLKGKFGHVSYERILSGPGIYNVYQFIIDTGLAPESPVIAQRIKEDVPAKVISDAALHKECVACSKTLEIFISIYGSEAGNLALKMMALAGVFIGGGIAPKILSYLKDTDIFFRSFCNKGRFKSLLEAIPIKVIINENTALLGACECARRMK